MVPQLVICHKCRAVLYESAEELKSTDEIIQGYDGRCPACGKKLSYIPKKVEVNPVDETKTGPPVPEKKKPSRKKSWKKHKERMKKREYPSYEPKLGSIWNKESV
jgi:hypothetical protein